MNAPELLSVETLQEHLIHQFSSEADLIRAIETLSIAFTTERERVGEYLKDPRLVAAYTLFYGATNVPKLYEVMSWMGQDFLQQLAAVQLIDVGAGPGTFTVAWWQLFGVNQWPVIQVETSELMKQQAQKLCLGLFPHGQLVQGSPAKAQAPKRLMLFGHSFNEMGLKQALGYIEEGKPDWILFVEPGTKETFSLMLQMREALIKQGREILYPCLSPGVCPMQGQSKDWCHQFVNARHHPSVERLTQLAHKDRRLLPLTVHLYGNESLVVPQLPQRARIVRTLGETKFSLQWEVCTAGDSSLALSYFTIEAMKKHHTKEQYKDMGQLRAGDLITLEVVERLVDRTRIRLLQE